MGTVGIIIASAYTVAFVVGFFIVRKKLKDKYETIEELKDDIKHRKKETESLKKNIKNTEEKYSQYLKERDETVKTLENKIEEEVKEIESYKRQFEEYKEVVERERAEVERERAEVEKFVEENLENLQEKYKDDILKLKLSNNNYDIFFKYAKNVIDQIRVRMTEADRTGAFKSDDEVGRTFELLYDLSADLVTFFENVDVEELDEEYLKNKVK
jgi:chromosome segregation ATPase